MAQTDTILSPKAYFAKLMDVFPKLKDSLWKWDNDDNFVHYNMERFADYTIIQIKSSNWSELQECFSFQEQAIKSFSPELENALSISYCEALLLGKVSERMNDITNYMGPLLKKSYLEYEKYYDDLLKSSEEKQAPLSDEVELD